MQRRDSLAAGALPIGLAGHARLREPVAAGDVVTWAAVEVDEGRIEVRLRKQLEEEQS